jgi:N-acetylglucosamine kinase-like BadF-type ATPase
MNYYLGVDIGATKSHALIADQTGRAIGFGVGGPGNYESIGWEGLRTTLQMITQGALETAGMDITQIAGAGFGIAGYDWPLEREPTLEAIRTLELIAPIEVVNDAIIGLLAGASQGWGIAIIAGTGENCWGIDRQRRYGRLTGNSLLMDEYGGASTIVLKALHAVARQWGCRGPATDLSRVFLEDTRASSLSELLEGYATDRFQINPELAPLIFQVAEAGDQVAVGVIRWAALGLADMVNGVVRQLSFENLNFEVVLIGGVFKGGQLILEPMKTAVREVAPGARFVRLNAPPVVGGVLLGMEQAGFDGYPLREKLIETSIERLSNPPH